MCCVLPVSRLYTITSNRIETPMCPWILLHIARDGTRGTMNRSEFRNANSRSIGTRKWRGRIRKVRCSRNNTKVDDKMIMKYVLRRSHLFDRHIYLNYTLLHVFVWTRLLIRARESVRRCFPYVHLSQKSGGVTVAHTVPRTGSVGMNSNGNKDDYRMSTDRLCFARTFRPKTIC